MFRKPLLIAIATIALVAGCSSQGNTSHSASSSTTASANTPHDTKPSGTATPRHRFNQTVPMSTQARVSVSDPIFSKSPVSSAKYLVTFSVGLVNTSKQTIDASELTFTATYNGKPLRHVDGGGALKPRIAAGQSLGFKTMFLSNTKTAPTLTVHGGTIGSATFGS